MLEKEFKFYIDNQDALVEKYNGKFLVIYGEEVKGAFDSVKEAYNFGVKYYKLGTFLIHECGPGEENYTQIYHTRAIFA